MATTRITDVINPEVLSDLVFEQFSSNVALIPGMTADANFPIPTKGTIWEIPYAKTIPAFETFIAGTPLSIQASEQSSFRMVVVRKGALYGADKIVKLAGFKNPMEYLPGQINEGMIKAIQGTQISVLKAGIPSANQSDGSGANISTTVIYTAKNKLGDKTNNLKYILMHSKPYSDLVVAGEVIWQPRGNILPLAVPTNKNQVQLNMSDMVPTVGGMIIYVTDECPVVSGSPNTYYSFLLGDSAMGLYFQQNLNIDLDYDASLKENYISPDFDFVPTLFGVDYTSAVYTTAQLETTGNYTLKWNQKLVTAVRLQTR